MLTVAIDLDLEGRPHRAELFEGIIVSGARLHYAQAQRMLEQGRGGPRGPDEPSSDGAGWRSSCAGVDSPSAASISRFPRRRCGLDASGVPSAIWRHATLETHRLIEEFMILANRSVGQLLSEHGLPVIYRVHEPPDAAALERFAEIARTLLPGARTRDLESIEALRRFLGGLPAAPLTKVIHGFFLRSMKQAVYAPIDVGHFGLGIERYCHFTSPIRRYPDLFNHRLARWLIRHPQRGGRRHRRSADGGRSSLDHGGALLPNGAGRRARRTGDRPPEDRSAGRRSASGSPAGGRIVGLRACRVLRGARGCSGRGVCFQGRPRAANGIRRRTTGIRRAAVPW